MDSIVLKFLWEDWKGWNYWNKDKLRMMENVNRGKKRKEMKNKNENK